MIYCIKNETSKKISRFANKHFSQILNGLITFGIIYQGSDMELNMFIPMILNVHPNKMLIVLPFFAIDQLLKWNEFLKLKGEERNNVLLIISNKKKNLWKVFMNITILVLTEMLK